MQNPSQNQEFDLVGRDGPPRKRLCASLSPGDDNSPYLAQNVQNFTTPMHGFDTVSSESYAATGWMDISMDVVEWSEDTNKTPEVRITECGDDGADPEREVCFGMVSTIGFVSYNCR